MNKRIRELSEEYDETFGEYFPILCFEGVDDDEIIAEIEKCLETNKPFEPERGVVY